jgi:hypothetical protein
VTRPVSSQASNEKSGSFRYLSLVVGLRGNIEIVGLNAVTCIGNGLKLQSLITNEEKLYRKPESDQLYGGRNFLRLKQLISDACQAFSTH